MALAAATSDRSDDVGQVALARHPDPTGNRVIAVHGESGARTGLWEVTHDPVQGTVTRSPRGSRSPL